MDLTGSYPLRNFAVDGTGQIVRPGDRVVPYDTVGGRALPQPAGIVDRIDGDVVWLRETGQPVWLVLCRRADDHDRDPCGRPLWVT